MLCGNCGTKLKILKNGMTLHDPAYGPTAKFSADLIACPMCSMFIIRPAAAPAYDTFPYSCVIRDEGVFYTRAFVEHLLEYNGQYRDLIARLRIEEE